MCDLWVSVYTIVPPAWLGGHASRRLVGAFPPSRNAWATTLSGDALSPIDALMLIGTARPPQPQPRQDIRPADPGGDVTQIDTTCSGCPRHGFRLRADASLNRRLPGLRVGRRSVARERSRAGTTLATVEDGVMSILFLSQVVEREMGIF